MSELEETIVQLNFKTMPYDTHEKELLKSLKPSWENFIDNEPTLDGYDELLKKVSNYKKSVFDEDFKKSIFNTLQDSLPLIYGIQSKLDKHENLKLTGLPFIINGEIEEKMKWLCNHFKVDYTTSNIDTIIIKAIDNYYHERFKIKEDACTSFKDLKRKTGDS